MSNELQHELDAELSQLIREYEDRGLPAADIRDALLWHSELASTRVEPDEPVALTDD
jgi:uncharacterized protein Smg (DUF494 family)